MVAKKGKIPQMNFEAALEALSGIVKNMESGTMPLAELVSKYEEGVRYLKICEEQLKHAEVKIQQIKESMGTLRAEPFDVERIA